MINLNEDKTALETLIDNYFFNAEVSDCTSLELNLTPACNQNCRYCYLQKHRTELYDENTLDSSRILSNLEVFFKFLRNKNVHFSHISIFSGEIWESDFGRNVLDLLLKLLSSYKLSKKIMIPSNMSFVENYSEIYSEYINNFNDIGVQLRFSASIDGKILDANFRPRTNNHDYSEKFYDKVFDFCKQHYFGFHPMVDASSVNLWIDNFNWYIDMFKKYEMPNYTLMMLEVRDDRWTQESINSLLNFLNYEIDFYFKTNFNSDPNEMVRELFLRKGKKTRMRIPENIWLHPFGDRYTCSIQDALMVRIPDLTIIPCHRTSYQHFNFGKFVVENNEIVDLIPQRVELATRIWSSSPNFCQPFCDNCIYRSFCPKGCLGAQFEANNTLFYPCNSVCEMEKQKIKFLIKKYEDLGLFKALSDIAPDNRILNEVKYVRERIV